MNRDRLKLKQNVVTRWNSTYDMFSRLLLKEEPLISFSALLQLEDDVILSVEEWEIAQQAGEALAPLHQVTDEISAATQTGWLRKVALSA